MESNSYFTDAGISQENSRSITTYEDILSSMKMTVINGVIQLSHKSNNDIQEQYIIKEEEQEEPCFLPKLTKEQYKQLQLMAYVNRQNELQRINAIKSKQLFFSRNFTDPIRTTHLQSPKMIFKGKFRHHP